MGYIGKALEGDAWGQLEFYCDYYSTSLCSCAVDFIYSSAWVLFVFAQPLLRNHEDWNASTEITGFH